MKTYLIEGGVNYVEGTTGSGYAELWKEFKHIAQDENSDLAISQIKDKYWSEFLASCKEAEEILGFEIEVGFIFNITKLEQIEHEII